MLAFGGRWDFTKVRHNRYRLKLWWRLGRKMDKKGVCAASMHSECKRNDVHSCTAHERATNAGEENVGMTVDG